MKPHEIEKESFKIIDQEAGEHGFPPDQWSIVRRMIHTTADFDYIHTVRFHPEAIQAGIKAIMQGKNIITDTEMGRVGVRKADLEPFGTRVMCFMNDPSVFELSEQMEITRAAAAVDHAIPFIEDGIYVIGNAPTALFRVLELMDQGLARPALVVGLPVGFVNAAQSKAALMKTRRPFISNVGRKGGSNVAASVVNALIKLVLEQGES
ncbi:MAG: precorrin-8X methylmutase [Deltaproteobacteria bacterium]|nr:precorrin-8X methylmutase [Deltaproteobacteria bacterium]MBW2020136.1 precorrin-8X methylmutase [Deltaproteobacteria bacterium]MBW2075737.1 precorrin-8X methylmutase [Deltaproteobacteria bacterium]RLB81630.1 MAG: precorrin-8X methylmutase [Deltaproteobacteria bacterium]